MLSCTHRSVITFKRYSRFNNNVIQLSFMLWLSNRTHTTLHIPSFVQTWLRYFDLVDVTAHFCITYDLPADARVYTSKQSFYKRVPEWHPQYGAQLQDIKALIFRRPVHELVLVVRPYCDVTATVHLRNLEGECVEHCAASNTRRTCVIRASPPSPAACANVPCRISLLRATANVLRRFGASCITLTPDRASSRTRRCACSWT